MSTPTQRGVAAIAWLAGLCCADAVPAPAPAAASTPAPCHPTACTVELAPGAQVSLDLDFSGRGAGATRVVFEQPDGVLQLRVLDAQGRAGVLRQNDAGRGARSVVTLVAALGDAAHWHIEVAASDHQHQTFRWQAGPWHAASAADRAHLRAEDALAVAEGARRAAGSLEHGAGAKAAADAVAQHYADALAAARSAGDGCLARMALAGRARFAYATGAYAAAADDARAALQSKCSGDVAALAEEAVARRTLGSAEGYLGHLDVAIAEQKRALALYLQTGDKRFQAMAQANLSANYRAVGATRKALDAAQAALVLAEAIGDRQRAAFCRESIAAIHLQRGEYGQALAAYRATLAALHDAPYPMIEGMSWNDMGLLYRNLGENDAAIDAFSRAETVWSGSRDASGLAETRLNRADVAFDAGRIDEARDLYAAALAFDESNGFQREAAHAHLGLGRCAFARADDAAAQREFDAALQLARGSHVAVQESAAQLALGDLASRRHDAAAAAAAYAAAQTIAEQGNDATTRIAALASRARLAFEAGDMARARTLIEPAIDLVETERAQIDAPQLRTGYFASQRAYYELAIDIFLRLHQQQPRAGHAEHALALAERARARALRDELLQRDVAIAPRAPAALVEAERAAAEALRVIAARSVAPNERARHEADVDAAARALDETRGRLRGADPRYVALMHPPALDLAALRAGLRDASVLEYWFGERGGVVWRITRDGVTVVALPSRQVIDAQADALMATLVRNDAAAGSFEQRAAEDARREDTLAGQIHALGASLVPPTLAVAGSGDVAIIADAEAQRLPFALFDALAARDLVYLPSLATLAELRVGIAGASAGGAPDAIGRDAIAIFADPVFGAGDPRLGQPGAPAAAGWARLPGTAAEAQQIAALFPPPHRNVLTGFAATRDAVMAMPWADVRIAHFATHASIDLRHPALSGIVLSQVDEHGAARDGILRTNDIYDLRMPVDLVVLGVCDATREVGRGAEGLFGLSRAFFHAGARRLLVSLWPVDDAASAMLMTQFYRHLEVERLSPQAALRLAQADVRAIPRWHAAYFWAGFVLHGDWT